MKNGKRRVIWGCYFSRDQANCHFGILRDKHLNPKVHARQVRAENVVQVVYVIVIDEHVPLP